MKNSKEVFDNIFQTAIPNKGETFSTLLDHKNIKIERIVSSDKIPDKVYEQKQDEWVVLLKGGAKLDLDGKIVEMKVGDYLFISAKQRHKVLKTEAGTVWLAVHIF